MSTEEFRSTFEFLKDDEDSAADEPSTILTRPVAEVPGREKQLMA